MSENFVLDKKVMSDAYWKIWNDEVQAEIDRKIEKNRKADGTFCTTAAPGGEVKVEQLTHEFKFGAHIFNFNQLGNSEYNDIYKRSYGEGGLFNSATVAFYWDMYEPPPGAARAYGEYWDSEEYWNSMPREEAVLKFNWRRPAPGPVIDFCKQRNIRIHGHVLIWGNMQPKWIWNQYAPESEKQKFAPWGIDRFTYDMYRERDLKGLGQVNNKVWVETWANTRGEIDERDLGEMAPVFAENLRKIHKKRVDTVAAAFGDVVDSWDVVNESSGDWALYKKSRTGYAFYNSMNYGIMLGDYQLRALEDANAALPAWTKLNINDYNISKDYQLQIKDLIQEGARIDIVGMQMHIFNIDESRSLAEGATDVRWVGTPEIIWEKMDMLAECGRPLHISEITIASPGEDAEARMIQAILARNCYRAWFAHPAAMGITWWNTVDGGGVAGEPAISGLFTKDMQKKPAYYALDQLINHEWRTNLTVKADDDGKVSFRGFRGTYRLTWLNPRGTVTVRVVTLTGDGVCEEIVPQYMFPKCYEYLHNFKIDGKALTLPAEENYCDLGKIYPQSVTKGKDGTQWAEMEFTVIAANVGTYMLSRYNDYYGELTVNGKSCGEVRGPWKGWEPMKVALRAGENTIKFRTRSGSGGKWCCGFRIADNEGLKFA